MATMRDVAARAEVSTTTVSHVLNGTRLVSEPLRERVLAAVDELDYKPSGLARSLRRKRTQTIGLILPDNNNPYFAEIARLIEDACFSRDYALFICNSEEDPAKERRYIDLLLEKEVDGIIFVFARGYHDAMATLTRRKVPWVLVDRYASEFQGDTVLVDNVAGGYQATEYLASRGHRSIGCITGPHELSASFERQRGYERALVEHRLPHSESLIVRGDFHVRSGYEGLRALMARDEPPTAIFACNDLMALGALRCANDLGLRVPADLSIVGFDDVYFASYLVPAITTVQQPKRDLAALSVELLLFRIANPHASVRKEVLTPTLVVRDSVASPVGAFQGGVLDG